MRKIIFTIALSFISIVAIAQDTIALDLRRLAKLKLWSELYGIYPNRRKFISDGSVKRDSFYNEYTSLIVKLKKSPEVYLSYINKALKKNTDSLRKQSVTYRSPGITSLTVYNTYNVKIIDLYRVVKYSLFERNDDFLPEDFYSLGVIDFKNYYGYYEPEPKRRAAIKYIIKKFNLNSEEKKFLKNKLNVGYVMDIKNFLDTCAKTSENEEFIKKSIAAFVKNKETPLIWLYNEFQFSKITKGYIPRDKEPSKQ